jgi:glucose dehydrogenase
MYVVTGNDDVFALDAKTGAIIWEHWSGIDQQISTVCCGWVNRGLAMGEGMVYLGQLDANVVALDMKTGRSRGRLRLSNGRTATASPARRSTMMASSTAASPAASSGCAAA